MKLCAKKILARCLCIFFILNFLLLISCDRIESSHIEEALGTVCLVSLFEQGKKSVYKNIFSRIQEIEKLMSVNILSSDISRINAAAGKTPINVHEDLFYVIEKAKYFAQLSEGAFDPTVGPLVSLWGIGKNSHIPSQEEIENLLPLINWRNIELDASAYTVFLKLEGMALDLGAIAKGYAADEAVRIAKQAGVTRGIIDLGGNVFVFGEKKDKTLWKVGIQNPNERRGDAIGFLQTTEKTIVTSGIYERYFEENGKSYHHIFDPFQGYPAQNGLLSVTVITDNSMNADALSTAVFVLGYKAGSALIKTLPGTDAVFIFEDKSIKTTAGVNFTIMDDSFYFAEE